MAGLLEKSVAQQDADRAVFHNEFLAKEEEMLTNWSWWLMQ